MRNLYKNITGDNIFRNPLLRNALIVSISLATVFPVYNVFFTYPSFTNLSVESTKNDAVSIAKHLASMLIAEKAEKSDEVYLNGLLKELGNIKKEFGLNKIKVFSKSGEIMFSTDPEDIANVNRQEYFRTVLDKGKAYAEFIRKYSDSLEGQKMSADVVETYVPIMSGNHSLGAFEIYYDLN